jgi:hypothetical protein
MSRRYRLEYPVDDPDEEDEDDFDEDDDGGADDDEDEEEIETWQVAGSRSVALKAGLSLTSGTELA